MNRKTLVKSYYAIVETSAETKVLDEIDIVENSANNDTYTSAIISEFEDTENGYDDAHAEFDSNYSHAKVKAIEGTDKYHVKFWNLSHFSEWDDNGKGSIDEEILDTSII